jgi:uncharacterized membrane protein YeaQ/YmgE (transglycosylase-associated protein family)
MGIISWIFLGLIAGALAKFVMPGPNAGGVPMGILLGVGGALSGGVLGAVLAGGLSSAIDVRSLLMAVCGTLIVILCYRSFAMRSGEEPTK